MIKKFFKLHEQKQLLNAYFYSILYYNSEIWLTPSLHTGPKQQLLSASANAIRSCLNLQNNYISFVNLHKLAKKSTPEQIALYKMSLVLYKVFNNTFPDRDWQDFANQIISTRRQTTFEILKSCNYKIGSNILSNKLACINRKVQLDFLNLPYPSFKYKMKNVFLVYER
jgi:hypothetical protein